MVRLRNWRDCVISWRIGFTYVNILVCFSGFAEVKAACCGLGKLNAEIPCIPISTYCSNRSNHVFWDIVHPTEATDRVVVNTIFDGPPKYTFPINIKQLIAV